MISKALIFMLTMLAATAWADGDCYDSTIMSPAPFLGNYNELFELSDGSIWKVGVEYNYMYEYYPAVIVCPDQGILKIGDNTLNVTRIFAGTSVPVDAAEKLARAYLMTTTASPLGNISELHIINTSSIEQRFLGTLYEHTGTQLGASRVSLHPGVITPHGRLVITSADLEDILGIVPWNHPAMLDVFGSSDFELMIKLTSSSGFVSNTNCVSETEVHNIEGSDSPDLTFIRFINIGDTFISNIHGNLYDEDGNNIGTPDLNILYLFPKEQYWVNSNTLAGWFDEWTGTATLKIDAIDNVKLLNLNFVDSKTFFNFSCFESTKSDH